MAGKLLLLGAALTLGGAASLAIAYANARQDSRLRGWPTVPGTVVSSAIVRTGYARLASPTRGRIPGPEPEYKVDDVWAMEVAFRYRVGDEELNGTRATSNLFLERITRADSMPSTEMREMAANVATGASLPVHYDPTDPRESYLFYRDTPTNRKTLWTGVVLSLVGVGIVFASRLSRS